MTRKFLTSLRTPRLQDGPLLTERLPYGALSTIALMLLVIAVGLVGFWPVNSQQIIEGYLTPAADSSEARNLLVPTPHGENFNSPLIGLFYVTPEEAADLPPGKPIKLTIVGLPAGDLSSPVSQISQISQISLEGTVMAPPAGIAQPESPTVAVMVQIPSLQDLAEPYQGTLRSGLRIQGRFDRNRSPRRLIDATGLVKVFAWMSGSPR